MTEQRAREVIRRIACGVLSDEEAAHIVAAYGDEREREALERLAAIAEEYQREREELSAGEKDALLRTAYLMCAGTAEGIAKAIRALAGKEGK